jgi:hypothetical protein
MRRREPPSLATWMLEHLTPAGRDEALGGDLLEEFRRGRSEGWYWWQVLSACSVAWLNSLRARGSLLVFALLWSMFAPAWNVLCDRIEDSPIISRMWEIAGGFWVFPALAGWIALHTAFVWGGMLIFIAAQGSFRKRLDGGELRRGFLLAPLTFTPLYGVMFLLVTLYWYSAFQQASLATTTVGQIADVRLLADVLRIPYLVALLAALWEAIPRSQGSSKAIADDSMQLGAEAHSDTLALLQTVEPIALNRFFGFMVAAGLMNAMIGGFLLCRLPESHAPSIGSLLIRAACYVAVGVVGGVAGTWLYWRSPASPLRDSAPLPFTLFALVCAAGWVWVPAMAILSEQISPVTALVAMVGAFVLATGLRGATYYVFAPAQEVAAPIGMDEGDLFAESLYRPPLEVHGYVIAVSLYAAGAALVTHSPYSAAVLLALSAAMFAWKRTVPLRRLAGDSREVRRAAIRLACVVLPAVLVTAWALLDGVAHRNERGQGSAVHAASRNCAAEQGNRKPGRNVSANPVNGYESIILWPVPEKKQIAAPIPASLDLLAPGSKKPLVIRFDGPYWYFQPPEKAPGKEAHEAQGSPLAINVQSENFISLTMEAHQSLRSSIPLARCREIELEVLNRDNRRGGVAVGVLVTDSKTRGRPTIYLGQQYVLSSEPEHFVFKTSPVSEVVRFAVPPSGIRRDQCDVFSGWGEFREGSEDGDWTV